MVPPPVRPLLQRSPSSPPPWVLGLLALGATGVAQAACPDLETPLAATERGYTEGDRVAAHIGHRRLQKALRCQTVPVPPQVVGRIHRASALALSLQNDPDGVDRALRAMLVADPLQPLAPLVPEGDRLHAAKRRAEEAAPRWAPSLRKPALVDGLRTGALALDQHYVIQHLQGGEVARGRLFMQRSGWRNLKMGLAVRNQWSAPARPVWHVGLGLGVGAVASLATSAGTALANRQGAPGLRTVSVATGVGGASALVLSAVALGTSSLLGGATPSVRRPPP